MAGTRKVGVLGTGVVGTTLADGFLKKGWAVLRGTRDPKKLADWKKAAGPNASVGSLADAAKFGDVVVLAVKGTAAVETLPQAGLENLAGKVVLDTTNPITDAPPENGVFRVFTGPDASLMERLQRAAPKARFVKAFSCVGSAHMVDPKFRGGPPTMFICGDDPQAKAETTKLLKEFGWDVEDMGGAAGARAIEPLAMLWCIPGFLRNEWAHAFKLLRT